MHHIRRLHRQRFAAPLSQRTLRTTTLWVLLLGISWTPACNNDSPVSSAGDATGVCVGEACDASVSDSQGMGDVLSDLSDIRDRDVVGDSSDVVTTVDADDTVEEPELPECDGERNTCGGCQTLENEPDTPCGVCEDGQWTCDDFDDTICVGASASVRNWWVDSDRDGYGDPETAPVSSCGFSGGGWADNPNDCDDGEANINPGIDEVCNTVNDDCDEQTDEAPNSNPDCTDACCSDTLICEDGQCLIPCDHVRCGEALELCCAADQICFGTACVRPTTACEYTEDCEIDEICEPSLGLCLPRSGVPVCEYIPPVGEFSPNLGCRWTPAGLTIDTARDDVVATPVVINLTDDNGDGFTDRHDIPDIVFLTYDYEGDSCCNEPSTLRIVSGQCNDDAGVDTPATMTTLASINDPVMTNDTGLAAGDLNGDGVPEIVAVGMWGRSGDDRPQGTIAFRRLTDDGTSWEEMWSNEDYPTWDVHTRGGPTISLANLDHDGPPEVIIGNVVLNGFNGDLLWDGNESAAEGETVGIGNNAFLGPASVVADVDLDGYMEVIAGNTLYSWDGEVINTFDYGAHSNSDCDGDLPCDGFNAVGNFDDDDFAEIVIVRLGEVFIIEHDMETLLWRQDIPVDDCTKGNESGPPTVADFDGDGRLEIGTAGADYYVVADMDCDPAFGEVTVVCYDTGILWAEDNYDCSSRATASSVFDFEGDGAAEVIYADEENFRIFDGSTGTVLWTDATHGSHTRIEMPVIADVDNDGNAEVVIPENGYHSGQPGLDVWEDVSDNWVRTRCVWNQHGYHVTNITEDGDIPLFEEPNWTDERLNNFRQNVQPAGLFDAPDMTLGEIDVTTGECAFSFAVTVTNEGALAVPPGVLVRVEVLEEETVLAYAEEETETRLFPGNSEEIEILVEMPEDSYSGNYLVRVTVDPDSEINECDEDDNTVSLETELLCVPK